MYRLTTKHIDAIASPGPTSTPAWTSPESTTTQVIVFGIITSVLSLVAVYFSYRQLQATRLRNRGCSPPTNESEADVARSRTLLDREEGPRYIHLSELRVLHGAARQPSGPRGNGGMDNGIISDQVRQHILAQLWELRDAD
ncbi:hypothetical protein F5144DRAFT_374926 [Chaetomium tenue]|uniref:Uncharacterized protein n=1 Tax=Chaetomium tenue TaxID=1854479 RepID=A0ACB7P229_9PEZI|nr:hypothetical protein F5144DRAFT_374926 [Chaetomium globosum]